MKVSLPILSLGLGVSSLALGVFPLLPSLLMISSSTYLIFEDKNSIETKVKKLFSAILTKEHIPQILEVKYKDFGFEIKLSIPNGFTTELLAKKQLEIEQKLNCRAEIFFQNGFAYLKVLNGLQDYYSFQKILAPSEGKMFLGYTHDGPVFIDFDDTAHIVTGGTTRSSKTGSAIGVLANAILDESKNWEFIIGDFKGTSFNDFEKCASVSKVFTEISETKAVLDSLLMEMKRRVGIFKEAGVTTIKQYYKKHKDLKRIIVFMDEFADIAAEQYLMSSLRKLLAKGGGFGIHFWLCTQKPTDDSIPTAIRTNCDCRIAFRVPEAVNSRTILGHNGAELIQLKGRALVNMGTTQEVQFMHLPDEKIKETLEDTYRLEPIEEPKKESDYE